MISGVTAAPSPDTSHRKFLLTYLEKRGKEMSENGEEKKIEKGM